MLTYPHIQPVAFYLGPLPVHWYGLMYLLGFVAAWVLLKFRLRHSSHYTLQSTQLADLIFYAAFGVIVGGRLGYVVFYNLTEILHHPLQVFAVWQGGMSFHGGLIGVLIATWMYSRKIKLSFVEITDFIAPVVPIGLGAGRIGNFINGELWGRVSDMPWAMVFPTADGLPRHPSQLYEFLLEGVCMFLVLWIFSRKIRPRAAVSGLFLVLYGVIRFTLEFFREPDAQMGFVAFNWMSQGQLLSLPMIAIGCIILIYAYRRKLLCNSI